MRRILLVVAYEGTNYCGWQVQPNGLTIEEVLNRELSRLFKEDIKVIGASRTDAGVHAMGNLAVFDTNARIPGEKIAYALNVSLPPDIRIQKSMEVAEDFHPRHCDTRKTYEYHIYNYKFENPLRRNFCAFTHYELDITNMRKATEYLIGEHDFKSFCNIHTNVTDTVRTIYSIEIEKTGHEIVITIKGNGFLYNMVRIIAGTLMEVGSGLREADELKQILAAKNREAAGKTAQAKGLMLKEIEILG